METHRRRLARLRPPTPPAESPAAPARERVRPDERASDRVIRVAAPRMRAILAGLLLAFALALAGCSQVTPNGPAGGGSEVKVLIVVSAEWGDEPAKWTGEGKPWAESLSLSRRVRVPGLEIPVFCTDDGVCLLVAGVGPSLSAASFLAAGLSRDLDLRRSYILVSGTAGVNPRVATIGSVAWIRAVVNADLCAEVDPRELPSEFPHSRFSLFCESPWCEPWPEPPGVLRTNPALLERALSVTSGVELVDDEPSERQRARYTGFDKARSAPTVFSCDAIAGASYWHGTILSDWASRWVSSWLGGQGEYGMADAEDFAYLLAARRLAREGLVDPSRMLILRAASNFDQQPPGTSVIESLVSPAAGTAAGENGHRVGAAFVEHVLKNWAQFREGPPAAR